jgi:hypothetical protein
MVPDDFTCPVIDPHGQPPTDGWRAKSPHKLAIHVANILRDQAHV